jgi:hypothetical protein
VVPSLAPVSAAPPSWNREERALPLVGAFRVDSDSRFVQSVGGGEFAAE